MQEDLTARNLNKVLAFFSSRKLSENDKCLLKVNKNKNKYLVDKEESVKNCYILLRVMIISWILEEYKAA